jgi:F-type H+-transporting ATPase subunit epsilon
VQLEVVTPKGVAVAGEADAVTAPGLVGEFGVLPGHGPFISALKPGVLRVRLGGNDRRYAVGRGYAEVKQNRVVILVEDAVDAENVDAAAAGKALADAEQALKEWKPPADGAPPTGPTQADWQNRVQWAQAQLNARSH